MKTMKYTRGEFVRMGGAAALGLAIPDAAEALKAPAPQEGTQDGRADLVVINARVYTVDDRMPRAEAFAVKHGRFIAVGSTGDVRNLAGRGTQVIDAERMTVVPGFIDTHIHPQGVSDLLNANCDVRTIAEIKEVLRKRAAETPPGYWVEGFKYDDTKVKDANGQFRRINRWDLDEAVPNHPVRVSHRGGHIAWFNSKALEMARVTRDIKDPPGGRFDRRADGELTGLVEERATRVFSGVGKQVEVTRAHRQAGVKFASEMMTAGGLTTVGDGGVSPDAAMAYQDAFAAGEMRYRVYLHYGAANLEALKAAGIYTGFGHDWIRFGMIKYSADGSMSGRTARLSQPYVGRPSDYGILTMTEEEIRDGVEAAHRNGYQIEIHANGDVTIDLVLKAYERAHQLWPRAGGAFARHQIEHSTVMNPDLLRRMAAVGVVPSMFTTYVYYHGEKWAEYGEDRMRSMFAARSFLDHGIKVSAGSDYVPGPFEPLMGLQSMVTRKDYTGKVWGENQRVTVDEALRISTIHGAYGSFEEDVKGSITAGKLADFVILGQDPHDVDPDQILKIPVVRTVVGGKTMHPIERV